MTSTPTTRADADTVATTPSTSHESRVGGGERPGIDHAVPFRERGSDADRRESQNRELGEGGTVD